MSPTITLQRIRHLPCGAPVVGISVGTRPVGGVLLPRSREGGGCVAVGAGNVPSLQVIPSPVSAGTHAGWGLV